MQIIGIMIFIYLAILLGIARHLRNKHESVWIDLGSPSLLNWSIKSSFQLGNYVFLSRRHRVLGDRNLSRSIYFVRAWFILIGIAIAVAELR